MINERKPDEMIVYLEQIDPEELRMMQEVSDEYETSHCIVDVVGQFAAA